MIDNRRLFSPPKAFTLLVAFAASWVTTLCAQTYFVTDLGTLGGNSSLTRAINSSGVAVGNSYNVEGSFHAVVLSNAVLHDLGTLGGLNSSANDINASGLIVGFANAAGSTAERAFLHNQTAMTDLSGLIAGSTNSIANGVNAAGAVVGVYWAANGQQRPFIYTNGAVNDLGFDGVANCINDSGQIGGFERSGGNLGFVISNGQRQSVGTLGGNDTAVIRINNNGVAVGNSLTAQGTYHAFKYQGGTLNDLGTLGGDSSAAYGINDLGQIVGQAKDPQGVWKAYVYRNGLMLDLNNFLPVGSGWLLSIAYGINDAGQIVGAGQLNGQPRGFLLTPNSLGIALYAGLTITGQVGSNYRIDYLDVITPTNTWQVLTTFVLPSSPYLYVDPRPVVANRFYRSVLLP